ncbi:SufD family Fe-S cluster assembly protein [Synechococcus sp. BSF8S]|uniref:SufB/SufD family protein n=1 Tax=Synechococcales TaxID=1890424 RepID=UPI00162A05A6|nr:MULTISPECIES: SufD family Fe-S cluster assembly protein [unclassified Synechococcus]MBC1261865.1 SufD family Fe-S cluster assembly protein [Synechococcus sp. BSF8S]MBC1264792.1 SufD family Fe-S cluster assembly protein [Synechococcus sp. BSA11S]
MVASIPSTGAVAATTWVTSFLQQLPAPSGEMEAVQWRGREALSRQPLPSRRQEDWRFTDLAPLTALAPAFEQTTSPLPSSWPEPAADVLRLRLDAPGDPLTGQSLPAGLSLLSSEEVQQALGHTLATCNCEQHWPVELNQATATRVLALRVSGAVATTLELVSEATGDGVLRPVRVLLLLEEKASLDVLQVQLGAGASLSSLVLEAHLGRESQLRHGLLALGEGPACLLAHLAVEQEPRSRLESVWASHGWALSRFEPRVVQVDGEATTNLKALQLADGQQLVDTHSRVEFRGPEGQLDQLHKAIADDRGRSVFNGAVKVPRAAQRTKAAQLSRNLLLSSQARIDTKPELEIVADDVRCAHGATVSRLQTDELFYLQSRGLSAAVAAGLLKRGFCEEVLRTLPGAAVAWSPLQRLLGEG